MRFDLKKSTPSSLKTSQNHFIRNFLRNGRVRVKLNMTNITQLKGMLKIEIIAQFVVIFQDFLNGQEYTILYKRLSFSTLAASKITKRKQR